MADYNQADEPLTPAEVISAETSYEDAAVSNGLDDDRRGAADQRGRPIRSFLYGNFRPRRRAHRRGEDDHRFIFDWHEPRVLYLALSILLLSCVDALFTLNLLHFGAEEANFLMDALLGQSVDQFLMVKIGLTAISLIFLVVSAQRHFMGWCRVERLLQLICIGYFGLIAYEIYLFNLIFEFRIPAETPSWVVLPG
jgi:hypothetical protein